MPAPKGNKYAVGKATGRPPKEIDWKVFEDLCYIQCTKDELSSVLHISKTQLDERTLKQYDEDFPVVYKRFSEGGKSSIRRNQFNMGKKNCSMAIWLGKQYLGQKDVEDKSTTPPNDSNITDRIEATKLQHENKLLREQLDALQRQTSTVSIGSEQTS